MAKMSWIRNTGFAYLLLVGERFRIWSWIRIRFADDSTGLAKGKILSELTEYVNTELQKIALWYRANKMAVNTSKTKS
jgi:hypothetical protein